MVVEGVTRVVLGVVRSVVRRVVFGVDVVRTVVIGFLVVGAAVAGLRVVAGDDSGYFRVVGCNSKSGKSDDGVDFGRSHSGYLRNYLIL